MMGIEVARVRPQLQIPAAAGGTFGEFTDSRGDTFPLTAGYRKRIWGADWDEMIRQRTTPTNEAVRQMALVSKGRNQVDVLESFLTLHGFTIRGKSVLEIGCYDGAACYALLEKGAKKAARDRFGSGLCSVTGPVGGGSSGVSVVARPSAGNSASRV